MSKLLQRQFRRLRRLLRFSGVVVRAWREVRRYGGQSPTAKLRAEILHGWSQAVLTALDIDVTVEGAVPQGGLLVSNHLSYLDIFVFSCILPCAFVSKAEVADWPLFGPFARFSGTIFVRREERGNSAGANLRIREYFNSGLPVVLFPEGTTTNGEQVLRFHSSMLQPAIDEGVPVTPCALRYELADGDPSLEVCWWGDMTLAAHVLNLLAKRGIRARVAFGNPLPAAADRKALSDQARQRVVALHEAFAGETGDSLLMAQRENKQ